jgi:transcriptional regulator with XRE-family HTH domain
MNKLAERLRLAREQAGLSQGQVARLLDLHRPTVSEIEAGRRRVAAEELSAFAKLYDVSLDWLTDSGKASDDELADKAKLAAREFAKMKPEDLDKVLKLLRTLRKSSDSDK